MTNQAKFASGKIYQLNVNDLIVGNYQPRAEDATQELYIDELAESIKTSGLLNPVQFYENDNGEIELVCGERRLSACKKLGWEKIPAMKIEANPEEVALIDNIAREDLTAIEEFEALNKLIDKSQYSQKQLADILGKSESNISRFISIGNIKTKLLNDIKQNEPKCPAWILFEIAKETDGRKQRNLFNRFKEKGLTKETFQKGQSKQKSNKQPIYISKSLYKSLSTLDINDLNQEDLGKFKENLTSLREQIDKKLQELEVQES